MDNDVFGTDYCIGFSTAVTRSVQFIHQLRTSTGSHERIAVVELFGRNCGETSLLSAYLAGVDRAIICEVPFDIELLASYLLEDKASNPSNYAMVTVWRAPACWRARSTSGARRTPTATASWAGRPGHRRAAQEADRPGHHLPAGRLPDALGRLDALDLMVAVNFANMAINLIDQDADGSMVALRRGTYTSVPIDTMMQGTKRVDVDALYDEKRYRPLIRQVDGKPMFLYCEARPAAPPTPPAAARQRAGAGLAAVGGGDRRTMDRPSPAPRSEPVRSPSRRRNGSNRAATWSGGSGAAVGDPDHGHGAGAAGVDLDPPAAPVVADGVLDQVGDQPLEQGAVAGHRGGAQHLADPEAEAPHLGGGRRQGVGGGQGQVERLGRPELALAAGQGQQALDQALAALVGLQHATGHGPQRGRVGRRVGQGDVDLGAGDGQGVRSSWEALATNRRWVSKAACSRSSIWSKVSASSLSSSWGPWRLIRSCRVLPSSRRAVAVMALSGRRTRPATSQPSPTETSAMRARATPDWPRSWRRVAACSWRRTASASRRTWRTAPARARWR